MLKVEFPSHILIMTVGRFAYFAPMNTHTHTYSANMVRLNLGDFDIGRTVDAMNAAGISS